MNNELELMVAAAASVGLIHTLAGPDHYVPFIMMARARKGTRARTAVITLLCGIGHVASSVALGFVGIALGVAVAKLNIFESWRGNIAAWLLTAFGFTYFIWGIHRAIRNLPHTHSHAHIDGDAHIHEHSHGGGHIHVHDSTKANITPWVLFTVFVFGPCEPLIPLIMYAAARTSPAGTALTAGIFAASTILTMLAIVMASSIGLARLNLGRFERYTHAFAGAVILGCGLAILLLGL
ncbi:MAG: sulfite exporter TauE/SafE family protein [Pseudomonadota bacterium]